MRAGPIVVGAAALLGAVALASKAGASSEEAEAFEPAGPPTTPSWWSPFRPSGSPSPRAVSRPWRPSAAGIDLIARLEGFRSMPYFDVKQCAIGYGTKLHDGPCRGDEGYPQGISEAAARALLRARAEDATRVLERYVAVPLAQPQIDALTSFIYNVGSGNFANSTLLRKLNAGDYAAVPDELKKWVYAGGQRAAGLIARRDSEAAAWNAA